MTAGDRLFLFVANPVGILDGRELQKGLGVVGGSITSSSPSTRNNQNGILPFSEWHVCLEYCIFNANVNMQKKSYLGDNFIAVRP